MNIRFSAIVLSLAIGYSFAVDPRMEQGAVFEAKGNYEMALGEYRAVLAEDPKNSEAYFAAAEVRVKMKDYSAALANYRLAYKFSPWMSKAYEGAARVYEILGQRAKADEERAKDPKNHPEPVEETAVDAAAAPEATLAVSAPEEPKVDEPQKIEPAPVAEPKEEPKPEPAKVADSPKPVEAPQSAETPKAAEPPKATVAEAAPVEETKTLPADPFERGKILFAEKNYTEAAKAWREVLKKTPGHAGAYYYAGLTRFEMGELDKAEFNLKKGLEYKEEGNEANYYLSLIYQKNVKVELEQKFLVAYLKKASPSAQNRRNAEERLATLKAEKAEAEKAAEEKAAEAAAAESSKSAPVQSAPVQAAPAQTAATAGDQANALSAEETAVAEPSIGNANLLLTSKNYEAALQMFKTLLEKEQNTEERYYSMLQMGNIYREMRDFHSAVTRYREVVQQFPDSDWAAEAERALEDAVWLEKHAKELPKKKR
ncbi:MAG: tetratricopeptide repeat protein [Fibrobacter sp.]|nr:tetratricopeptide repeat protein [Fibrobacter sp.]